MKAREPARAAAVTPGMVLRSIKALFVAGCVFVTATAQAEGIRLKTLDGAATTLADQVEAGRWTLMMIWTTYCGVCRRQYPIIADFHTRHHGKDASVVGLSVDGYDAIDTVRAYVAEKAFPYPTVVGEPDIVGPAYEKATGGPFTGTPSYLLFDPARRLVAAKSGEVTLATLENFITQARE